MRIGVDLGGTKIEIIALGERGETLARERVATPQGDYTATVQTIAALVAKVERQLQRSGTVGIGIPGAETAGTGLIKNANSTCLIGHPFRQDLQIALQREVRLANDANCFALSEAIDGAGAGADCVFGVILGTGVGGGIVIRQQVLSGANRIAGEWGHNPLPYAGGPDLPLRPCYCGRQGCIETYLSGPALQADYQARSGQAVPVVDILQHAAKGQAAAQQVIEHYLDRLARSLAGVINMLDPDVIVLGGGLSQIAMLYTEIPRRWGPQVFSDDIRTRLSPPLHGDASGVRGAAWLWD